MCSRDTSPPSATPSRSEAGMTRMRVVNIHVPCAGGAVKTTVGYQRQVGSASPGSGRSSVLAGGEGVRSPALARCRPRSISCAISAERSRGSCVVNSTCATRGGAPSARREMVATSLTTDTVTRRVDAPSPTSAFTSSARVCGLAEPRSSMQAVTRPETAQMGSRSWARAPDAQASVTRAATRAATRERFGPLERRAACGLALGTPCPYCSQARSP